MGFYKLWCLQYLLHLQSRISINVLSCFTMQGHENAALLLLDKLGKEHINLGNAEGKT